MRVYGGRFRWIVGLGLSAGAAAVSGCGDGDKVVEIPIVTEESLSPEQRAQWEEMKKNGTATAPGLSSSFNDPGAHMKQMMEQYQASQNGAGVAQEGN